MEIPDALQRLDMLTSEESGMVVARNLEITHDVSEKVKAMMGVTQDVDGNVKVIEKVMQSVDDNMKIIIDTTNELKQNESSEECRTWFAPPSPPINHNISSTTGSQHG